MVASLDGILKVPAGEAQAASFRASVCARRSVRRGSFGRGSFEIMPVTMDPTTFPPTVLAATFRL